MAGEQPNRLPPSGAPFFASWSGGKDSCLALHRARAAGAVPAFLLTIIGEDGCRSKSHGLRREVLEAQAAAIATPLILRCASWDGYEQVFIAALKEIRAGGCGAGVFGDIDFPPHLEWENKVCALAGMRAYLPLWECAREELLEEFIALGYKAVIVTVNEKNLDRSFLGRTIDRPLLSQFRRLGIDPCGENGEYHTLVVDGPIFSNPLPVETGAVSEQAGYCSLDVRLKTAASRSPAPARPKQ